MKPFDLIQIGIINRPLGEFRGSMVSDAVNWEYMGNARFEGGVFARSMREMESRISDGRIRVVEDIRDADDAALRMFHFFDTPQADEYVKQLHLLREGKVWTEERTNFEATYVPGRLTKYDIWWDFDNHVVWSFDKIFMNRFKEHLLASLKHMNEEKAKREERSKLT